MTVEAPRKPWLAGLLTLAAPGLGQIYNGQLNKGVCFYGLFWAVHILSLFIVLTVPRAPFNVAIATVLWLLTLSYIATDAVRTAKNFRAGYQLQVYNRWYVYLLAILAGTLGVMPIIKYTLVQAYQMPSGGMMPTLQIGDYFLANKLSYGIRDPVTRACFTLCNSPKRNDLIIFIFPEDRTKDFVQRVIGLAGETVEIRDRKVYIDGRTVEDPHARFTADSAAEKNPLMDNYAAKKIPENRVFVLGDYRDKSYDSRFWGFVDVADVKGKAAVIYWSWDSTNKSARWERLGKHLD